MIHMDFLFNDRSLWITFECIEKHFMQLHYWEVKCVSLYEGPQFLTVSSVFYILSPSQSLLVPKHLEDYMS